MIGLLSGSIIHVPNFLMFETQQHIIIMFKAHRAIPFPWGLMNTLYIIYNIYYTCCLKPWKPFIGMALWVINTHQITVTLVQCLGYHKPPCVVLMFTVHPHLPKMLII